MQVQTKDFFYSLRQISPQNITRHFACKGCLMPFFERKNNKIGVTKKFNESHVLQIMQLRNKVNTTTDNVHIYY